MNSKTSLLKSFFDRTSFTSWKSEQIDNYRSLEIIINDVCDQRCLYCYEIKYGHHYFTEESKKPENILKNVRLLIQWLNENNYKPVIDLFSSEIFSQEIGFDVLNILLEELPENYEPIIIPTNMNFLFSEEKTNRIEKLIDDFGKRGIKIILSASVDGKFMEENRPIITGYTRDDIFYEKLFSFAKKHFIGFHPMVYSNRIEYWKDNWLWFQEMFKKHDTPFWNIYLLEVRNVEWTPEQCTEMGKFMRFLVQWTYDFFNGDKEKIADFVLGKLGGFNILQNPFSHHGRGIGCSIQSTLSVRAGDLMIVPCHRTSYKSFNGGQFVVENDKIVDIVGYNSPLYILIKSFDSNTQPVCETCYIKHLCTKGCLGAQFEVNRDLFTPIPTVCRLEHVKIAAIVDEMNKLGVLGNVFEKLITDKRNSILLLMEDLL